jgi:hypothetical protein
MMMGIIIKDLSNKLNKKIEENKGVINVDAEWVNNWLTENSTDIKVSIVDKDGQNINDAKVAITKK